MNKKRLEERLDLLKSNADKLNGAVLFFQKLENSFVYSKRFKVISSVVYEGLRYYASELNKEHVLLTSTINKEYLIHTAMNNHN